MPSIILRPQQMQMMAAIRQALESRRHLCVESGTGTGKTLGYLLPVLRALAAGGVAGRRKRIAISTATKALQEQIVQRELPLARELLAAGADGPPISPGFPIPSFVLKGRQNYLCLSRFEKMLDGELLLPEMPEPGWLEAMWQWRQTTRTGDQAETQGPARDPVAWNRVAAHRETCTGQACRWYDACFLMAARRQAGECSLLIINHHLFFADLSIRRRGGYGLLPELDAIVFDEAHDLEAIATKYFGYRLSPFVTGELLQDVQSILPLVADRHPDLYRTWGELQTRLGTFWQSLLNGLRAVCPEVKPLRLVGSGLNRDAPLQGALPEVGLEVFLSRAGVARECCPEALGKLFRDYGRSLESTDVTGDEERAQVKQLAVRCAEIGETFDFFAGPPATGYGCLWEVRRGTQLVLEAHPISVAGELKSLFEPDAPPVICTSATMTYQQSFAFFRKQIGMPPGDEIQIPSPFDYRQQAAMYIPRHLPNPNERHFIPQAAATIIELISWSKGRTLVLCTSLAAMRAFYDCIRVLVPYPCLIQDGVAAWEVVEQFRQTSGAVLFASIGLWQGVDIPGEQLSSVIMDRMPFPRPDEPVHAARARSIVEQGGDPFMELTMPRAILLLRQGFGRLIRSARDRGIVSLLDGRAWRYERILRQNLPDGLPMYDSMDELKRVTATWFASSAVKEDRPARKVSCG